MKFTSKQKGQTPRKLIDYLMSGFLAQDPPPLYGCELDQPHWISITSGKTNEFLQNPPAQVLNNPPEDLAAGHVHKSEESPTDSPTQVGASANQANIPISPIPPAQALVQQESFAAGHVNMLGTVDPSHIGPEFPATKEVEQNRGSPSCPALKCCTSTSTWIRGTGTSPSTSAEEPGPPPEGDEGPRTSPSTSAEEPGPPPEGDEGSRTSPSTSAGELDPPPEADGGPRTSPGTSAEELDPPPAESPTEPPIQTPVESTGPEGPSIFISPQWIEGTLDCFSVNKLGRKDHEMQLVLKLPTIFPGGNVKTLEMLIDTGCEANLINMRLCPADVVYDPELLLKLVAANGQQLYGGQKAIRLSMLLKQEQNGVVREERLKIPAEFYLADIRLDAILSYPWMRKYKLGVFPDLNALATLDPFILLFGEEKIRRKKVTQDTRVNMVSKISEEPDLEALDPSLLQFPDEIYSSGIRVLAMPFMPESVSYPYPEMLCKAPVSPAHEVIEVALVGAGLEGGSAPDPPTVPMWAQQPENFSLPVRAKHEEIRPTYVHAEDMEVIAESFAENFVCTNSADEATSSCQVIYTDAAEPYSDPRIDEYIAKIHEEFDDIVLCADIQPNPPVRGVYGWAYIPLKPDAVPEARKPIFMHGERLTAFKTVTENWLNEGLIEMPTPGVPLTWMSPAFVVPKKSATFPWRGVVDMRGPNSQTLRCSYPLPKIEDILVKHGAGQIFSVLDLRQAFHQQPLHPDSRPITTTHTPRGAYQWKVNIMGLTNAPQQFQAMIEDCLQEVREIASPYIDDIIVSSSVEEGGDLFEKHFQDLRRVMQCLQKKFLIADKSKCNMFVKSVEYCGHILEAGRRRPAPGRLMAIEKWERPKNISALRAFLGFTNYYSSYIPNYATYVHKLQDKLKVGRQEGKKEARKRSRGMKKTRSCS